MNELQRMKEAYKDLENKSAQVVMVYILVYTAEKYSVTVIRQSTLKLWLILFDRVGQ